MQLPRIEVDGHTVTVLPVSDVVEVRTSPVRTALVADTLDELTSPDALMCVTRAMLASVARRGIRPKEVWCVGHLPADAPYWTACLEADVVAKVKARLAQVGGHLMVYALFDSADALIVDRDMN